jgi:hypothetical protein
MAGPVITDVVGDTLTSDRRDMLGCVCVAMRRCRCWVWWGSVASRIAEWREARGPLGHPGGEVG